MVIMVIDMLHHSVITLQMEETSSVNIIKEVQCTYTPNLWSNPGNLGLADLKETTTHIPKETCLQRKVSDQEKVSHMAGVPTWRVSPHDGCPHMTGVPTYMTGIPTWWVSPHDRYPHMMGVPTWQVSPHDGCPHMTGVPTWQVSLHDRCPYMTGVPTWQVSPYDRDPYMTINLEYDIKHK